VRGKRVNGYEKSTASFDGFVSLACAFLALNKLLLNGLYEEFIFVCFK
jgi:hypothetical protein